MASNSETGHAVNVSNFKLLFDKCTAFGASYNPSNPDLLLAALNTKWQKSSAANNKVNEVLQQSKNPINERQLLFAPGAKLVTRIVNALKGSKVSEPFLQDVKTLADRYRGLSKAPPKAKTGTTTPNPATPAATEPANADEDEVKTISTSHLSYVQRANTFNQLVVLLATETGYAPNEADLKLDNLQQLSSKMAQLNNEIGTIIAPLENLRITRNRELYTAETGLVDIANDCKSYIKSAFGATSAEAKLVTKIRFKRLADAE